MVRMIRPNMAANIWRKIVSPTSKATRIFLPMNSLMVKRVISSRDIMISCRIVTCK